MIRTTSSLRSLCYNHPIVVPHSLNRIFTCCAMGLALSLSACGASTEQTMRVVDHHPQPVPVKTAPRLHPANGYSVVQRVTGDYAGYPDLNLFIEKMVRVHGFERNYLYGIFSQAQRKDWTLNYLAKSDDTAKSGPSPGGWTRYRAKFLDERHISDGVEFAYSYRTALRRAYLRYGVPEEYILGILAVETIFGGNVGNHRVLDALTTLSFDYARRGQYFQEELEDFLLMTRREGIDPTEPVGSFAGAMGLGQFMPSSFLKYAVDFNGDGRRNLWDPEDAIGSIANYFVQHGWRSGQPVVTPLATRGTVSLEPGIDKQYTIAELEQAGLHAKYSGNPDSTVNLLLLRHTDHDQYLIGYPNFYTITRYNHSTYYAMAVHEVAQAIKQQL